MLVVAEAEVAVEVKDVSESVYGFYIGPSRLSDVEGGREKWKSQG